MRPEPRLTETDAESRLGAIMETTPDRAPNCLKCRHFSVTWDPRFPRACAMFGLKTSRMPSHEVFQATGKHCPAFEQKAGLK